MSWGLVIAGGSALIGGYMSKEAAEDSADAARETSSTAEARYVRAEERLNKELEYLSSLTPPNLQQYILPYQQAVVVGRLTPEEAVAQLQEQSAMDGVQVSPDLISAQKQALSQLKQVADEGGLTAIDRARLFDAKEEMATASRGAQEAILQEAQRRGVGGSGMEMANRMLAQQAAATRGARAGVDVAAEAQRRALEAIQQSGALAGTMRNQEFSEQARKAEATDAINRFNTDLTNRTQQANIQTRNAAQAANLAEAQRISEFNIGQREREAAARLGTAQNQWQNIMNLATGRANLAAGQASNALNANSAAQTLANQQMQTAAGQNANAWQQFGTAAGKIADAFNED